MIRSLHIKSDSAIQKQQQQHQEQQQRQQLHKCKDENQKNTALSTTPCVDLEISFEGQGDEAVNDFATLLWESSLVLSWYLINVEFKDGCCLCIKNKLKKQQQELQDKKKQVDLLNINKNDDMECEDICNNNGSATVTTEVCSNNITTLEIGAGIALPSLVSCSLGANAIITDRAGSSTNNIFDNVANIIRNNQNRGSLRDRTPPKLVELSYGVFSPEVLSLPPVDYLLASDLFYNNTKDYDDIFATLSYFINVNPNMIILLCYQVRSVQKTVSHYLQKWKLVGHPVELDFLPIDLELRSDIELYRITSQTLLQHIVQKPHLYQPNLSSFNNIQSEDDNNLIKNIVL